MAVQSISISEFNNITQSGSDKILNPQRDYLFITINYTSSLNESTYTTSSTNINKIFNPVIINIPQQGVRFDFIMLWPYYIVSKIEANSSTTGFYYSTTARYTGDQYMIEFQGFSPTNNKIGYLQIIRTSNTSLKFYHFEYNPS